MTNFTIPIDTTAMEAFSQGYSAGLTRGIILGVVVTVIIIGFLTSRRDRTPKVPKKPREKKPDMITNWLKTRRNNKMELPKIKFELQKEAVNEPEMVEEPTNFQVPNNVEQVPVIAPNPAKKGEIYCVRCKIKLSKGWFKKIIMYEEGAFCDTCSYIRQRELNKK